MYGKPKPKRKPKNQYIQKSQLAQYLAQSEHTPFILKISTGSLLKFLKFKSISMLKPTVIIWVLNDASFEFPIVAIALIKCTISI